LTILDTSFVVSLLRSDDDGHREAVDFYEAAEKRFATTPLVLAEIDYMLHSRGTPAVVEAFYAEVRAGTLGVEWWPKLDVRAAEIADRYADLGLGLVDASLVALAGALETTRIATFDERHFRPVEPLTGGTSFVLLPADA
jgi:predicted nucleic acid-binding protein